jgi:superfamily II DNA or RNA helicase
MEVVLNPTNIDDYATFLRVKSLPVYSIQGRSAWFPDEYANRLGIKPKQAKDTKPVLHSDLFDYQRDIAALAIRKKRFAVFADCGLGKTLIMLEFARHVRRVLPRKRVLIVSPLMVVEQTIAEANRFYVDCPIERVSSSDLSTWIQGKSGGIGITNYEALRNEVPQGNLGGLLLDESSLLKSHYGKYGQECIRLGAGLEWKLALTGTPAPNDRIEYGNHAVFLDQFPTVNAFLARYFVNRGQTQERWELRPHAIRPFYTSLSHWCIFLSNPAVYGWKDNCGTLPPINVHIHDVALTDEQARLVQGETGQLFSTDLGGIVSRQRLARIAKGKNGDGTIETHKPEFIRRLVESFGDRSAIVWCKYNDEQDALAAMFPEAANISGDTPHEDRLSLIDDYKAGRRKLLISKPKILGFGLNLQRTTKMIFSTLQDSYEEYYQAIKRANRYGATEPLDVHIPLTDVERPMVETVLRKAKRVQQDTEEQERIFRDASR